MQFKIANTAWSQYKTAYLQHKLIKWCGRSENLANVSEYLANVSEYLANVSEYLTNVSEYLANVSEYLANVSEYLANVSEYLANVSEYLTNISEYIANVSEYLANAWKHYNTVNSEIFARVLFSQNFAYTKFHENKILVKWRKITLSFTDIGKPCPSFEFLMLQICVLTIFWKIKFSQKFPNSPIWNLAICNLAIWILSNDI